MRNLQTDICGPGGDWQNGKRHPGQIIHGQNSGRNWQEMLSWGRSQKWAIEKLKLDSARRLRGIFFIDPEDKESKETIGNARKIETPMVPALPCKTCKKSKNGETLSKTMISSLNLRVSWQPMNPQESTPCIDDHHFKEEGLKSVGEVSNVCSQIVLKCVYLARIGRLDILWSVNKLARSITKWTKACDKRLNHLSSYIHHTCNYKQYCHVGNTAKQCWLGLFQDSDFAGDLDSKSTSSGTLCIFGSHTFVPISWMCKKQTSVSHSSPESEIISFDAGLRLDGIPALDLLDLIVAVLGNTNQNRIEHGDLLKNKRAKLVVHLTRFTNATRT